MSKVIIGIDPGIKGAIAAINANSMELLEVVDCPTTKNAGKAIYNISEMADIVRHMSLYGKDVLVILEQQQAMPKQGTTSMFSIGRGFGIWEGILATLGMPCRSVRPTVWTRRIFEGISGEGKFRSIRFALQMFPGIELTPQRCKTPRDGRADAACLAYWGMLWLNGTTAGGTGR